MADDDLTVRARIDDELSAPLGEIRRDLRNVADEAERSSTRASRASRGWATFGRVAKGALMGIAAGAAAAGYGAYRLLRSSITQASDLNESLNAVNVTYGKQAAAVKKLGREAAKSLGLSNVEFNSMAVQFSAFATAIGGEGKGAVKVLDEVTTRAADFASVMNIDVAEAAALFQSGLAGETEPLRRYGINLSAAAVGAYAVEKGLAKSATTMTDAAKVQATYGLLMESTEKTAGDFANTSDSLANQQRILGARFDNAQAKLGRGLLPVMQKGAQWLNREGVPAFLRFSDWFNEEGLPAIGRFVDKARTFYAEHGPKIKSTLADVRDVVGTAAAGAERLVEAFLSMPSWARKALVGGAIGGAAAKKFGLLGLGKSLVGGRAGGGSGLLGAVSKAQPIPVYVVNNDGGLGGDGTGKGASGKAGLAKLALGSVTSIAVATAGTIGIKKLSDVLAPDTTKQHNWGSPGAVVNPTTNKDGGIIDMTGFLGVDDKDGKVKKSFADTAAYLDLVRAKAAGFGRELDLVGSRKVKPEVKADSITRANDYLARFIGMQVEAGRPVAPYITINGYDRAMQQIATLTSAIHSIPTAGVDNGATYVSGGTPRTRTPRGRTDRPAERRGSGQGNVNPYGSLIPRTSGRAATAGVVIHDGAIRVDARGARSDVDVASAVRQGIEDYVREREERR